MFVRSENDLRMTYTINLVEALVGFRREVSGYLHGWNPIFQCLLIAQEGRSFATD